MIFRNVAFYIFIGLMTISLLGLRKLNYFPKTLPHIWAVWGAGVMLSSTILLPWITFEGKQFVDDQLKQLSRPKAQLFFEQPWVQDQLQKHPQVADISDFVVTGQFDDFVETIPSPETQQFARLSYEKRRLNLIDIAFHNLPTSFPFMIMVYLILGISILVLTWTLVLTAISHERFLSISKILYGVGGVLLLVFTLWQLPLVDTLGHQDEFLISVLAFISGARVSSGIGWALVGECFLVINSIMLLVGYNEVENIRFDRFDAEEDEWWD